IAVGEGTDKVKMTVKVGDKVMHDKYSGTSVKADGEEFLILLPETDLGGADAVAGKIQKALSTKEWKLKDSGQSMGTITVSMGISMYAMNEPGNNMIKRADDALYMAKNTGRNQIVTQASIQG
ncbi:MAG: diguanylate cyclase, partial [Proteobacteria bacterium]|nr:diguanylate cyclase [Pseudomonadota bacterium]